MKTNKISICLIGSAFIHLAMLVTVAKMPAMHEERRGTALSYAASLTLHLGLLAVLIFD